MLLNLRDRLAVFTWLGKLQNLALEGLLSRRGVSAKATSFRVYCRRVQASDCLSVFRAAVEEAHTKNPLPDLPVENVVDLGPHFELLSEAQQKSARGDWFQPDALIRFVTGLSGFRLIERDTPLGVELASLAVI